jgi:hypothetical protein
MWTGASFLATTFTLCVLYGLLMPPQFHSQPFLEMVLPGFKWISFGSFVVGLVETFLYGGYSGFLLAVIHNAIAERFFAAPEKVRRSAA